MPRYRCIDCNWTGEDVILLDDPHPLEDQDEDLPPKTWRVCPNCRSAEHFHSLCETRGCPSLAVDQVARQRRCDKCARRIRADGPRTSLADGRTEITADDLERWQRLYTTESWVHQDAASMVSRLIAEIHALRNA